ncbi:heme NO-binding domain-containing protein [Roseovarius sp. CAU 1744]|uniref:heme NO-binding domain-containing protein n=1 Tax=Roseovarius sp. CAU 1744 TaxID=3140368 RepID=UPI00325A7118
MHGLINRSVERFVHDTYGEETWAEVMRRLDLGFAEFEPMLTYDDELTVKLLDALAEVLDRPDTDILEDIGTYLVSHPSFEALRRLMRFGGVTFVDFLHSVDDLPERARLAVADLNLPEMELREITAEYLCLTVHSQKAAMPGFGHVAMGLLRAMADDYGALVFMEVKDSKGRRETVEIRLLETAFASGREFELGARAV